MKMKNLLTVCQSLIIMLFLASCSTGVTEIYVAPDGKDDNQGSKDAPLSSFTAARDMIRTLKAEDKITAKGITVLFREGTYPINSTLELSAQDSGTVDVPVTYKAYKNEKVIFSGGKTLQAKDFKPVKDPDVLSRIIDNKAKNKILQINLKEQGITNYGELKQHGFSIAILPAPMELFVNKEPQTLSRYPNEGKVPVAKVIKESTKAIRGDFSYEPGIIAYDYDRPQYWQEADKVWLWGYFLAGFADDNLGVAKIDTANKAIHLEHAHMFGMIKTDPTHEWGGKIVGYYAYNILEEIDMPGEYYIDRDNGIMYYYPVEGFENAEISVSVLKDPVLAVENTHNIHFENIIFECGKGMGIYLEAGSNVKFAGCTIRNFGTVGAMFGQGVSGNDKPIHNFTGELTSRTVGNLKAHHYENTDFENNAGKDHGFLSCDFYNLGTGAIVLSGGDRKTLTSAGNYIENCEIHDFNRWNKTYCSGIKLYGVGNIIKHNYIYNAPHQAIEIFGNEHLIEYNHIEKVVMEVHDMGAIYMGRNPSERGNVVRHNYIANNGKKGYKNCALHVDDGASDMLIEGNVFYNTSRSDFADILLNGGNDNIIRNNIFIKGAHTLWIENPYLAGIPKEKFNERYYKSTMWGERMLKEINMNSPAWEKKYPDFEAFDSAGGPLFLKNLEFYNNVIVDEPLIISKHNIDTSIFEVYHHNYQTKENPGFVNMEEENFTLKENSIVFEKIPGFKPIPFDEIGLYNDKYRNLKK